VGIAAGTTQAAISVGIWQPATGTASWNTAANWNPSGVPNAVGANATFNNAASGSNPAQTGNRTASLDAAQTVGSITFNNDAANAFTNTVSPGTSGSLTFDETAAGPAVIDVTGNGTGNNTISAGMTLNDNLVANVNQTTASSAAGALNLTGAIGGPGGFTKNGDGLATFGTGAKTYTGATVLNGGRTRMSLAAHATATSGMTINAGAQLTQISAGTYNFGSGTLNLNGSGPTSGPFAVFPGAIRPDTGLVITIGNAVNLQSNTVIHVQATAGTGATASPTGSITLSNAITGPGKLILTAANSNIDQGSLILPAANSYTGGTLVQGGILQVTGANATLGTADVTIDDTGSPTSIARLSISSGVLNAIIDSATLSLLGGGTANVADENFAILGAGVNETVGGLVLGGVPQTNAGTYGATGSGATFVNDEYFSGTGVVTLVPEPAGLTAIALAGLALRRRRR
jgi:MYXO-CTERM domain-containing protein